MIMQEFEPRRRISSPKTFTNVENQPISNRSLSNSTSTFEIPIAKRTIPFPYLKRKSIRVDWVLKQQKLEQQKKNHKKLLETLRNENNVLETENLTLKGRILQMEFILQQLKGVSSKKSEKISFKNQSCQSIKESTQPKKESNNKKDSIIQCSKCNKCLSSKYFKYHSRICGNTQLERLLSEKDLKTLQSIRKNQKSAQIVNKPKNNWRIKRGEFLEKIRLAQKKTSSKCIIFYRPNFRRANLNQ
ncbi:hypothetical protein NAEGRDRAFT_81931 [Naegleria gruberi]|uniref:Uncharacterized protein n=1 Tax=Naegleria gruberi TaxID=5762 RepID=D2W0I4_NAEGR|nr:uncharacterized protein NAEGRDRAFT_81931 [Naegleria gruberi]EFC37433.1 hypothetical protein NAEGRDRAFT_81931 [Naegleria gruberi]|eukprot:XP_002670177.1 hypothetical protein NAEGRDRAFT_81931 [Naegleria gruberi strain NEG-M]